MAKSSLSRREFLKVSALSSTTLAMSSCANLDRYFMGDSRDLKNEVIILGAGAAGLAAAFELKKRKIPFRIFEASSRVGGRIQSVNIFPEGGPIAELGAEYFEESHSTIFTLAKELNLTVQEVKRTLELEPQYFSFDGKTYRVKDLLPKLKTLQGPLALVRKDLFREQDVLLSYKNALQFERSAYYDTLSLKDLLGSWQREVDPVILKLIEIQAVSRFGVDAKDQSALHFLATLDAEGSSLLMSRPIYRMERGLSELTQTLAGRISGVITDYIMRLNAPLTAISEKRGEFQMTFNINGKKEIYTTRNIICTVPFSKLKDVEGIYNLEFSEAKKELIKNQSYATHSKGVVPFTEPFWRKTQGKTVANLGNFSGDFVSQRIWDSGRAQAGTQGLLTYQRAGASGLSMGAGGLSQAVKDLGLFYAQLPEVVDDQAPSVNWSAKKWSQGSMAYFKPGQYMKYKGVASEPEYQGRFLFAGEHTSMQFAGTVHGALETGRRAALEIQI